MTEESLDWSELPTEYALPGLIVRPNLVLAPMEGVTDRVFRSLVRSIGGCGMTWTEFVPARGLASKSSREMLVAALDPDEHPVVIQVYGNDPELLADGARVAQELGADAVDLNMGCPSKKVCANSGGSGLMRDPALVRRIVAAMREAVSIPLTVKMRSGWDLQTQNAPELARICVGEGADALAVHWRTRTELYSGTQRTDVIARVKATVSVPVLANGDVMDVASAHHLLSQTGCDGLMIGRGAIRNPWIFQQIRAAQEGRAWGGVSDDERLRVLLRYYDDIRELFHTEHAALGRFKSIAKYFTRGVDGGAELRLLVLRSQTAEQAVAHIRAHFGGEA